MAPPPGKTLRPRNRRDFAMIMWCPGRDMSLSARQAEPRRFERAPPRVHSPWPRPRLWDPAYFIAARRTALGRPGGLHRSRRHREPHRARPAGRAAGRAARGPRGRRDHPRQYHGGGNPARMVGLAAGLSDSVPALTVDRQCASGLDAILFAMRAVALGEADVDCRRRRANPSRRRPGASPDPRACSRRHGSSAWSRRMARRPTPRTRSPPPRSWHGGSASRATSRTTTPCTRT